MNDESFVHKNLSHYSVAWALGFTARIVKLNELNLKGDLLCGLAVTFCNPKDKHFCKRIAREEVRKKELTTVRVRDLPKLLGDALAKAHGWPVTDTRDLSNSYNYVLKRFV